MVKLEFISLYTTDEFLSKFHERNFQIIKDNQYEIINTNGKSYVKYVNNKNKEEELCLPNLPKLGKLDINQIIYSKYMIT